MLQPIPFSKISLRTLNRALTVVVAVLALYIIAAPFLPEINWWARHNTPLARIAPSTPAVPVVGAQIPAGEVLAIPEIDLQNEIHEGGLSQLHYGVWRLPYTSTPDKGGNTVLVGHRFTYTGPQGVFYFLDKIAIGDPITLYWHGAVYRYRVASTTVVEPSDISVEAPTKDARLTLYTCTPLWTSRYRLVIVATPVKGAA